MAETGLESTPEASPEANLEASPETTPEANPEATIEAPLEEEEEEEEEEEDYSQVAILIFKTMTALDFVGPYEVLHLLPHVKVMFVSHTKDWYTADLGMLSFHASATFDGVPDPDIIVVPGGGGVNDLLTDAALLDWIRMLNSRSLPNSSVR